MSKNTEALARLIRFYIIRATTAAGSGHLTSSLSATDLMTALMFGGYFRADLDNPGYFNNDRLIFSKGHASPLLYALYAAASKVSEDELLTLRTFGSPLEGHPTMQFPYTEAATGSLGQGLSIGVGMALNAKLDRLPYRTFVLLGDSEMAEGSNWEAIQIAAHYKLGNLIAILDVNRLGQRGETMYGYDVQSYAEKFKAFGWNTIVINGHDYEQLAKAFAKVTGPRPSPSPKRGGIKGRVNARPTVIIAKTVKGKGVKFVENKDGWHGKALSLQEAERAIKGLGKIDNSIHAVVSKPEKNANRKSQIVNRNTSYQLPATSYKLGDMVATRKAYGNALVHISNDLPNVVALDAEVSNSTYADIFKKKFPKRFLEMYIAEQNMVGAALGLSRRGKIPFVSTFSAFFSRAFDQIRMSQYSNANIKFVGSHAGVSIGEDGASQMGLEDIALFRSVQNSVVLYPCDAVSTENLVRRAAEHTGNVYLRTTRKETLVLYPADETFKIGGSKTLHSSKDDMVTVVAAGITVFEALQAYNELKKENIFIRVIDLYSIKPLDVVALEKAARETGKIITVEDHYAEGGIGEAVRTAIGEIRNKEIGKYGNSEIEKLRNCEILSLAVRKMPRSGKPEELLVYEEIDARAIVQKVKKMISYGG